MTPCSIVAAATRLHTTVHSHVADVHTAQSGSSPVGCVDDDENDDTFLMRHHRPHKIQKRAVRRRKHPPLPHVDVRLQLHASRYTEVAANPFSSARRGWPTTSTSRPMDYHCSRSARRLMFLLARTLAVGRHARHDDLFQHFVVVKALRPPSLERQQSCLVLLALLFWSRRRTLRKA